MNQQEFDNEIRSAWDLKNESKPHHPNHLMSGAYPLYMLMVGIYHLIVIAVKILWDMKNTQEGILDRSETTVQALIRSEEVLWEIKRK